jgi:type II secretory pathway pseudopilin PulG
MSQAPSVGRKGFSIVELFVLIGIILLLLALILPAIQQIRESSARATCLSNLRQIGIALHHFHSDHNRLPPLRPQNYRDDPNGLLSWRALILPYIEEDSLWAASVRACRLSRDPWQDPPHIGLSTIIKLYVCPDDSRLLTTMADGDGFTAAFTSYIGVGGGNSLSDGAMVIPGVRLADITDGTSNTLMVGERPPPNSLQAGQWYPNLINPMGTFGYLRGPNTALAAAGAVTFDDPCTGPFSFGPGRADNPCDRYHFWSFHPGGACFVFADNSSRFLPYAAKPVLVALATRAAGEVVDLSEFD